MAVSTSTIGATESPEETRYRGIPVSPGIAFGRLHFRSNRFARPRTWPIEKGQAESEIARLKEAIATTRCEINTLKEQLLKLHISKEHPLDQSLVNGTQTIDDLFADAHGADFG